MNNKQPHSLRVAYENWINEDRFKALIVLLQQYDTGIGQIALFSSAVHTPLTLTETRRRAEIMAKRLVKIREAGYSGGINILATIGHHHEDLDHTLGMRYQTMVNSRGEKSLGTYCMNDTAFLNEYVSAAYCIYAKAGPDFIWIDDDIRYVHMPIGNGCFCDTCVKIFNEESGYTFTREALCEALERGGTAIRRAWLKHNGDAICRLFRVIGKTVRSVSPAVTLGFMTGERYFESYNFTAFADALSDGGKYEIMWRPGGGAYTDRAFDDIVEKSEQIGRQCAYLPSYVIVIQSEIENFPYNLIKKTPLSTAVEAAVNMTVGCTGAAFNILPSETLEPIETVKGHLAKIASLRPFCEILAEETHGLRPCGIHTGWRIDSQAAVSDGEFINGWGGIYASYCRELFSFGLPECYHKDAAVVCTLTGNSAAVMEDDEIISILSGGVYLDAPAIRYLAGRGFGELIGFAAGDFIAADAREKYFDDPLNEGITGGIRNCRQAFNSGDSFTLLPLSGSCRILTSLVDYHDNTLAVCASGLYENKLGGRICAAGYYPFSWISDYRKTIELKRIFAYLSGGILPSYVENYCRIRNITLTGNGKICVTLFNTSNDSIIDLTVLVRGEKKQGRLCAMYGGNKTISAAGTENICGKAYSIYCIGELKPYEGTVLVI